MQSFCAEVAENSSSKLHSHLLFVSNFVVLARLNTPGSNQCCLSLRCCFIYFGPAKSWVSNAFCLWLRVIFTKEKYVGNLFSCMKAVAGQVHLPSRDLAVPPSVHEVPAAVATLEPIEPSSHLMDT